MEDCTICMAYTTVSSKEEARQLVDVLLDAKVIACANILSGVTSCFLWEGEKNEGHEVAIWLKTPLANRALLEEALAEHHPYQAPFMAFFEPESPPAVVEWLTAETTREDNEPTEDITSELPAIPESPAPDLIPDSDF